MSKKESNANLFDPTEPGDIDALAALAALDAVDHDEEFLVRRLRESNEEFALKELAYRDVAARFIPEEGSPAPDRLRGRVMESIANIGNSSVGQDAKSTDTDSTAAEQGTAEATVVDIKQRRPIQIFAAAAAAAVAVLVVTAALFLPQLNSPEVRELQAQVAGGVVQVSYAEGSGEAEVSLQNVPAPPEGQAYQMWIIDDKGTRSVGVMEPEDITSTVEARIGGFENAKAFMISQEPTGGSESPSTPVVEFDL